MDARSDWQWLPEGLLDLIVKKLGCVSDYIRFSVVCKHWHSLATDRNLRKLRIQRSSEEPPRLIIPAKDGSPKKRCVYLICQGKVDNFRLRVPYNRRSCGSSHGWLAFAMKDQSIILYNPFTRHKLDLPCLNVQESYTPQYLVHKIVLSANPSLESDNFEAVAIHGGMNRMSYIKFGQKNWTHIPPKFEPEERELVASDVIFHQNMIYAVNYYNQIVSTNPTTGERRTLINKTIDHVCNTAYLVESSRAELYSVRRFFEYIPDTELHKTSKFIVYKIVKSGQDKFVRKRVNDLDGDTFFLGDNQSMSVVASKFPGCRPNCIYFADDYHEFYYPDGPHDMGIYHLEDRSFEMHYEPDLIKHKKRPPPIWIIPTPK